MDELIVYSHVETALGTWLCAKSDAGVCLLVLDSERGEAELAAWIERHAPGSTSEVDPAALAGLARQLEGYFAGERRRFDLTLDRRGTEFELSVWRALSAIPFGATTTYGELAVGLGQPGATQAVGGAAGRNPLPVLIPCHRLLARGGLGGFSGGLPLKRRLLALEGVAVQTEFL